GTALDQSFDGDSRSFTLNYVDWDHPERNAFHAAVEYSVERNRSMETARPDIVLFVNGIPFAVIECKSPKADIAQAVSQSIRNQGDDYIPRLFVFAQLVMGINKNTHRYATVGSKEKFWAVWKETGMASGSQNHERLQAYVNKTLPEDVRRKIEDALEIKQPIPRENRRITDQDIALFSLCRPERLLELTWKFTVFDNGEKKIARYQQYFVVKSTLDRVKMIDKEGRRQGGIIWHTQGSGKSLTMIMLARNLALDPDVRDPRMVLVTDRDDLDKQLGNTFTACGLQPSRATSGKNLHRLIRQERKSIITTLIHKFDKAISYSKEIDDSADIFVLVDESHRSQFGSFSARMRQMFPRACYLGFTGTPLLKKEKNNFIRFGGLIEPHYSISQAVEDKAVVPLLYEGRMVNILQNKAAIDLWFERHTEGLSLKQQADLKQKYAKAEMLNKTDQVVYMNAFDISEHYRANWQGTGFKAQLVSPDKVTAIKYRQFLKEIGMVSSEVLISSPDTREGYDEVNAESKDINVRFWKQMMAQFGNEEEYNKQLINRFKYGPDPEIIIVVDKLLTGFDAPRNAVLYLCKTLREHALLQAIARVNRLYENKDFGYIVDYANVLGALDQALTMYSEFEGFDEADIEGTMTSIQAEIEKLPERYSAVCDIFKSVKNKNDEEEYEVLLADEALREEFYQRLTALGKTLAIALSSEKFVMETPVHLQQRYKSELKKYQALRASVKLRYADGIDYRDYEPKIKKLLDTHIQANDVQQLNEPVNIFDENTFHQVKNEQGVYTTLKTTAARADMIAHEMKRSITEKMEEDPTFYEKFSILIQQAIDAYRAKRLSDLEYLNTISEIREQLAGNVHDDAPKLLGNNADAVAYFGTVKDILKTYPLNQPALETVSAEIALKIDEILLKHRKVQFWDDKDAQNRAINEIDDYFYDVIRKQKGIEITYDDMDAIIEKTFRIAKHRNLQ
ncbi:MAG: HsdR family type I site-specific deoxyribonuclease, partial [Candidatus Marinimicrobia bacterium]|nr:HsdR family type I site-specific deoxyribonuclease [Candidatus Neomarinimicrobiota bacterium]